MSAQDIVIPDLGGADEVEVIEIAVSKGDQVAAEDPILTVESDKASVDLPAPAAGKILEITVKVGDKVREGDVVGSLSVAGGGEATAEPQEETEAAPADDRPETVAPPKDPPAEAPAPAVHADKPTADTSPAPAPDIADTARVHAGPAVRKLARELGADLGRIKGTGPKHRILKEDVQGYIKKQLQQAQQGGVSGSGIPGVKLPDFSQFGKVERESLSRIHSMTAANMHRSWLNVPHVTQFDEADITDLEDFRKGQKAAAEQRGVKLTPLPFLLKACARALQALPQFNVALDLEKQELVRKQYIHIGIAVDTPAGLMVPVIRDVDQKGLWALAEEAADLAERARNKQLKPAEMQGACFTITSLGGIGGTAFTPIVNTPEVAILGVSKAAIKPVWDGKAFQPRLMLPLSLSYDHRAVNGADGARFTNLLAEVLGDIRRLLL
ncbi:MAG: dihydrolipoyllysine-residue acetyltransferase [Marinobacter sp.]|nr:dihydrolipoyllysine-residue acetyltransferase [Marinobacter sp.]